MTIAPLLNFNNESAISGREGGRCARRRHGLVRLSAWAARSPATAFAIPSFSGTAQRLNFSISTRLGSLTGSNPVVGI
jgi:hypothetical protein